MAICLLSCFLCIVFVYSTKALIGARRSHSCAIGWPSSLYCSSRHTEEVVELQAQGERLQWLLEKAQGIFVDRLNKTMTKSKDSDRKDVKKPIKINFSNSYRRKIDFPNKSAARHYLGLPVEQYSLLNSSYVSRSPVNDDNFILSIPFSSSKDVVAKVCIAVKPQPELGLVEMRSSDLSFDRKSNSAAVSRETDVDARSGKAITDLLPKWLVVASEGEGEESVKSSIQAVVNVQMKYDKDSASRWAEEEEEDLEASTLSVQSKLKVHVNMNLPLQADIADSINFPPISFLLSQAGKLTAQLFINTVAPYFVDLLIQDYNIRRGAPMNVGVTRRTVPVLPLHDVPKTEDVFLSSTGRLMSSDSSRKYNDLSEKEKIEIDRLLLRPDEEPEEL
jgi:hypothetical protein